MTRSDEFWRTLLAKHAREDSRLLFELADRIVRDPALAEDACQHALLAAWKNRHRIEEPRALKAWLCKSVVNAALATLRRRKHERKVHDEHSLATDETLHIDERIAWRETLVAALADVPEPARSTVVMRVMQGLSGKEVADVFGCSKGEVSKRLHRGLEHLRRYMSRRHLTAAEIP